MAAEHEIRALVLDFDGLILDTESTGFEAWRAAYEAHGVALPRETWCAAIGTDTRAFDPLAHLCSVVDGPIDVSALQRRRRRHRDTLIAGLGPMPGVTSRLREARARGLRAAIASSSPRDWIEGHLARLGLASFFDVLATEEDVAAVKPAADLYLHAVDRLGARAEQAIALEDSPNGVAAAKAAGLVCVAVPGPMTRDLCFARADLVIPSLRGRRLSAIVRDALAAAG